jgi:hypothetical protein
LEGYGGQAIFASMQQPADFFCKEIGAGASPAGGSISFARVIQQQRHDVESVASASAIPAASTNFMELKPQQIKETRQFYKLRHTRWTSGSGALPNPFIIAQGYATSQLARSSDESAT